MNKAPIRIPNYEKKMKYLVVKQAGNCAIAESMGWFAKINEIHHAGIPNTIINRRLFPNFVHSLWNLLGVNHYLHMDNGSFSRISLKEARKREDFLAAHPCISKVLNMEE